MPRMNLKPGRKDLDRKATFKRLMKYVFHTYPIHFVVIIICIVICAVGSISASIFMPKFIDEVIQPGIKNGFDSVKDHLVFLSVS